MKYFIFLVVLSLSIVSCKTSAEILEFDGNQSMCITGKGPGQDAATNPFEGEASVAVVKNKSRVSILARVKTKDGTTGTTPIPPKKKRSLVILPGTELFIDSPAESKAKVYFKRFGS